MCWLLIIFMMSLAMMNSSYVRNSKYRLLNVDSVIAWNIRNQDFSKSSNSTLYTPSNIPTICCVATPWPLRWRSCTTCTTFPWTIKWPCPGVATIPPTLGCKRWSKYLDCRRVNKHALQTWFFSLFSFLFFSFFALASFFFFRKYRPYGSAACRLVYTTYMYINELSKEKLRAYFRKTANFFWRILDNKNKPRAKGAFTHTLRCAAL